MGTCVLCGQPFAPVKIIKKYCSARCSWRAADLRKKENGPEHRAKIIRRRCNKCNVEFETTHPLKVFCSKSCKQRIYAQFAYSKEIIRKAQSGLLNLDRSRNWRGLYTPAEISALRSDPFCILPNRSMLSQWKKCQELKIKRDGTLRAVSKSSPEARARHNKAGRYPDKERRATFRRRVRKQPEVVLATLRKLARGHAYAEDIVIEGFATVLRLAIPAAEAFKLAKAEVNRTSAQPFRDQSFNPDIDYNARETGRQVARASDIRAANGDG